MTYGWLIMLIVIGAVNVVGRIAAKKAESQGGVTPGAGEPDPGRTVRSAPPVVARVVRAPKPAASPVAPVKPVAAKVVAKSAPVAAGVPVGKRASAPSAKPVATKARSGGKRWTGGRLREVFIAGEILGAPRSVRPLGGSAHEAL